MRFCGKYIEMPANFVKLFQLSAGERAFFFCLLRCYWVLFSAQFARSCHLLIIAINLTLKLIINIGISSAYFTFNEKLISDRNRIEEHENSLIDSRSPFRIATKMIMVLRAVSIKMCLNFVSKLKHQQNVCCLAAIQIEN